MKIYIKAAITDLHHENPEDRQDIALDPNTPVEILEDLSNDRNTSVLLCLLCNPSLPDYLKDKLLSNSQWSGFLEQVASCLSISPEILTRLSDSEHNTVRCRVAWNPNTPVETLIKLSQDDDWTVRSYVAGNKNTPIDIIVGFADAPNIYCRGEVAENPSTPIEVLRRLITDDSDVVRGLAKRNLRDRERL